jgi:hypothetical protein
MIICDAIHVDPSTGKNTLLGLFSSIVAQGFPATQTFCVYAAVSDGRGTVPMVLRLVTADEEEAPLWELEGQVSFDDPRMFAEMSFVLQGVVFPQPGEYRVQLYSGIEHLMERRILVRSPEGPTA